MAMRTSERARRGESARLAAAEAGELRVVSSLGPPGAASNLPMPLPWFSSEEPPREWEKATWDEFQHLVARLTGQQLVLIWFVSQHRSGQAEEAFRFNLRSLAHQEDDAWRAIMAEIGPEEALAILDADEHPGQLQLVIPLLPIMQS